MVTGTTKTTIEEGSGSKVFDGFTYYLSGLNLYKVSGGSAADTGISCSSDYQIYGDTVYWTVQNGFGSEVYMQSFDQKVPVQVTRDGGYISSFTVYSGKDSEISLDYTLMELTGNETDPYGRSYARTVQLTSIFDLEITEVQYDADRVIPGADVEFMISMLNRSTDTVENVHLRVKGRNSKVLYNEVVFDKLEAGGDKTYTFSYTMPNDLAGLSLIRCLLRRCRRGGFKEQQVQCGFL